MQRLGRYEILNELGRGGTSIVYQARDTATNRPVAIKLLSPHLPMQADVLLRFEREIKLAVLLEHAHIVPILDVGLEGDQPYIVLRLLTGGSLADRIRQGPIPLPDALPILRQVASALDEAHRLQIIHRDIKPSNILFDRLGAAYLADFGIAKALDAVAPLTISGIVGTPAYMSPEQLSGLPLDERTDQYGLGIVAFFMLTGRLPFEGTTAHIITQHLLEPLPAAHRYNPLLPAAIQAVLERATAKVAARRYASAGEFITALTGAAASGPVPDDATPVLDATDLVPAPPPVPAQPAPAERAPSNVAFLSLAPPPSSLGAPPGNHAAAAPAAQPLPLSPPDMTAPAAPISPRAGRSRLLWPIAILVLVVALLAAWRLGLLAALLPAAPTSTPPGASATISIPASLGTLAPDVIALAVINLPPGSSGAEFRSSPTGASFMSLPNRTLVQVLRGRAQLPDASFWVLARLLTGETGWVAEALLSYLDQPAATSTPGGTPSPASATTSASLSTAVGAGASAGSATSAGAAQTPHTATPFGAKPKSTPAATSPAGATSQPGATSTAAPPPATQPGAASASPQPVRTNTVAPAPSATRPPATPTRSPAPTATTAPTNTPLPTNTPAPPPTATSILPLCPPICL